MLKLLKSNINLNKILAFSCLSVVLLLSVSPILSRVEPAYAASGSPSTFNPNDIPNLSKQSNVGTVINNVIKYISIILTGLFVLMMLIGAVFYMVFSATDKKDMGMDIIKASIFAGILALLSWVVWSVIVNFLQ
jgi:hypothetical protein